MQHEVPIQTLNGVQTPYALEVETQGTLVRLGLKAEFVGRDVDEEIELAAFEALLSGGPKWNFDLLGLSFETDGGETVLWTVGVGSGNERFLTRREDLTGTLGI